MGIFMLIFSAWIAYESTNIPQLLVSNEPGPRLFPFISAMGIAVFAVLSMIFDGKKEKKADDPSGPCWCLHNHHSVWDESLS